MARILGWVLTALLGALPLGTAFAQSLGEGRAEARIKGDEIEVYTYRPAGCAQPSILLVFHGNGRTAESYRDAARPLADRACLVIYAPLFDKERFPNWRYHRGGLVRDGELQPEAIWTADMVDDLIDWAQAEEGRADAPAYLFGHSAGGQFLSRVAAYDPPGEARRIVIANPSTYVWPDTDENAPYGFDRLGGDAAEEAMLRDYLAAPVTVFLGGEDTGDEDLTNNRPARRQGENRLDRGHNVFEAARQVAEARGWVFNWRLVTAEGIAHAGGQMMRSPEMLEAMGFGAESSGD
ncbi:lysophospholipase [Paracoccus sp. Z118]|uniref:alpha/beta hydrolase n=1 Tax=Paracoccus sp. Z118 TaxID=2851017 RepID=UPI001C2C67A4|nr:lysophospholipase [Paracoccus sp. Z118]MBV0892942.1 lysophospholipase [Paracoccus sp. Z118]